MHTIRTKLLCSLCVSVESMEMTYDAPNSNPDDRLRLYPAKCLYKRLRAETITELVARH